MELFGFKHLKQQSRSDCLVACAAMILTYLEIPYRYSHLSKQLGMTEDGAPFSNLRNLETMDLSVDIGRYRDSVVLIERHLSLGLPIVTPVKTWALPHWDLFDTDHAVVVVGLDHTSFTINDPSFENGPHTVPIDYFMTAWSDRDFEYGVIGLTDTQN